MPSENLSTVDIGANNTNPIYYTISALCVASTVINFLFSLPLNSYVLWLITMETRASRASSEFFAVHLAVSDILFCLGSPLIPLSIQPGGYRIYKAMGFFVGFVTTGRPMFQTCICVERYLAVLHPVLFLKYKPLRYRLVVSGLVWLIVLTSCLITSFYPMRTIILWCGVGLFLFLIMSFCCLSILSTLKKPGPGEGGREREREGVNQTKMRAFKIISVILVTTMVSYMPMVALLALHGRLGVEQLAVGAGSVFCVTLTLSFIQPLLYLHRSGKLLFVSPP